MKKGIVAFVSAVLLSASFGVAAADRDCGKMGQGMMGPGMGQMGMGRAMMGMMNMAALGLDSRQTEAVKGIRNRTMKEMVRKRADLQIAAIELNELLTAEPVDMKAVESALRKTEALRTEMRLAHIKARLEIMSVLTPAQKRKFDELMRGRHMMRGMGRRGMMGPGMGMMQGMDCGQCDMMGMSGGMGGMMMDGADYWDDDDRDGYDRDDRMTKEHSDDDMKGERDEHGEHHSH